MEKNASGSVMSYFADLLFFEFLRSLSPGCLIELKHWRFCFVGEIEFLDEFSRLTWTMHWTLRSILSKSLKLWGRCVFLFVECLWPLGWVKNYFSFIDIDILTRFCMEERFFWKDDWFFLQMLNDKCAGLLRLACVQLHAKQLVCHSWISSLDITTLNM